MTPSITTAIPDAMLADISTMRARAAAHYAAVLVRAPDGADVCIDCDGHGWFSPEASDDALIRCEDCRGKGWVL